MTRLKILFLVVVVLVSVKCTFFEDKSKKEEQLEFVEYVTNTEEPTVYTDCHSFRDSMIHQAKIIGSHLSFIDSSFVFNTDEYSKVLDDNIYNHSKQANGDSVLLMFIWILFMVTFIYCVYNIHNNIKLKPLNSKVKRRRLSVSTFISVLTLIVLISLFMFTTKRIVDNQLNLEKIQNNTLKEYFLKYNDT